MFLFLIFPQRQQSGEAVLLYKGGAGQAGHVAAAADDNSSHPVSQQGVRPVCVAATHTARCLSLFIKGSPY